MFRARAECFFIYFFRELFKYKYMKLNVWEMIKAAKAVFGFAVIWIME